MIPWIDYGRAVYRATKRNAGFSLTEIVVAMMVIAIMVAALTPLLSMGYSHIMQAGEQAVQLGTARGQMEERIAGEVPNRDAAVSMTFTGGTSFTVVGGIVESASSLSTFLPNLPVINLNPAQVNEGYAGNTTITVTGIRTNFGLGTTARAYPRNGGSPINLPVNVDDSTSCTLTLPVNGGLKNSAGSYVVAISYSGSSSEETARSLLTVNLPPLVAVGAGGTIVVADQGNHWETRDSGLSVPLNAVEWCGNRYIAVGADGRVAYLADGKTWITGNIGEGADLNGVAHFAGTTVIVGNDGTVLYSTPGADWSRIDWLSDDYHLQDVTGTIQNSSDTTFVTVGRNSEDGDDKGVIITLSFSGVPSTSIFDQSVPVNGVCVGDDGSGDDQLFVAVGNEGLVLTSGDASEWTEQRVGTADLRAVCHAPGQAYRYVAVGDGGTIYRSADGSSWESRNSGLSADLADVTWTGTRFVAVGASGEILTSADGGDWTRIEPGSTDNLNTQDLYGVGN